MENTPVYRRTQTLVNHLNGSAHRPSICSSSTSSKIADISQFTQEDFSIRDYVVGKDDVAFKALDFLCCQGVKTQLYTEFLLKYAFEQIQPNGWCCVAEDEKGEMVGIARSYIYQCLINGRPSSTSYAFLTRVHPHHRRNNLGAWLISQLFYHDVTTAEVEYMSSWVIIDNLSSLGLQDRVAKEGAGRHGMPPPDNLGMFRCMLLMVKDVARNISLDNKQRFVFLDENHQQEVAKKYHGHYQFFPLDTEALFGAPLNLGAYAIFQDSELLAVVNIWNSGVVRVSCLRDSNFRSDDSVLAYNHWYEDSPRGQKAFLQLLQLTADVIASKGFRFINLFFPDKERMLDRFEPHCKLNVLWMARVWYVGNTDKLDMKQFPDLFYDPRECLV